MHIRRHAVDCLYIRNASLFEKYHYVRSMVVMVSVLSSCRCMATSVCRLVACRTADESISFVLQPVLTLLNYSLGSNLEFLIIQMCDFLSML